MAATNQKKRRKKNRQYWQGHDEGCRKSGLTRQEYCTRHNLNIKTFAYWRHRLKEEAVPVKLVQLPSHQRQPATGVRLVVNGCGIEVAEGFHTETLAEVIGVLRRM
jgi:hypothetical protein